MLYTNFQPRKWPRSSTLQNAAFIEAKIVILAPFVYHISIFSLIMVVKKFGPFHSHIRPLIGAIFSIFLVGPKLPLTEIIVQFWDADKCISEYRQGLFMFQYYKNVCISMLHSVGMHPSPGKTCYTPFQMKCIMFSQLKNNISVIYGSLHVEDFVYNCEN